jgi:hypothetical protein
VTTPRCELKNAKAKFAGTSREGQAACASETADSNEILSADQWAVFLEESINRGK